MGIGGGYVYTMEGIGEKALIYGLLLKSVVSFFLRFRGRLQLHRQPEKPVMGRKTGKNGGIV